MTGYLQRLAASVQPQASRIRPVVDPLFAGPAARSGRPDSSGLEEVETLVPAQAGGLGQRDAHGPDRAPRQTAIAPRPAQYDVEDPALPPDPRRAAPRATEWKPAPAKTPDGPFAPSLRAGVAPPASAFAVSADGPSEIRSEAESAQGAGPALLAPQRVSRSEPARLASEAARRREADRAQAARPDDIHISIGRVEVIAAPPPARAAAPVSKATSLEDYLRGVSARRR